ncbi:hypothetical protein GSI_13224 [Ganoderma sinense ZZ0214-1]|uniref:Uncharacterized protein n=1 Tax=Ganoderma sinense ZZ0214-1 TaxID=1077348 RepID=A0A2G8RUZ3_9APHY|nr:hypothetical protein GSI_13224 [Ganoderma sinense ZZ0214-1]
MEEDGDRFLAYYLTKEDGNLLEFQQARTAPDPKTCWTYGLCGDKRDGVKLAHSPTDEDEDKEREGTLAESR